VALKYYANNSPIVEITLQVEWSVPDTTVKSLHIKHSLKVVKQSDMM